MLFEKPMFFEKGWIFENLGFLKTCIFEKGWVFENLGFLKTRVFEKKVEFLKTWGF